jgi:hypothetical protein
MAIVFKIRRNSDGLFSMGGSTPGFNKTGKIWKQKGHVTSHLSQLWGRNGTGTYTERHVYADCEIVPYELTETPAGPGMTIALYLAEIKERKQTREDAANKRHEEWQKEKRRKEYENLRKEFEE